MLDGGSITNSGGTVCLTLLGRFDASPYTIQRVSLVKRDGQTLDGLDATVAELTFGGSWNSGATVLGGTTLKSDPISFNLAAGEDVFLTFWAGPGQNNVLRKISFQTSTWIISGDDQSETIDWEGLTISDARNQIFAAIMLDVIPNPPLNPLLGGAADVASGPDPPRTTATTDGRLIINELDPSGLIMSWFAEEDRIYQLQRTYSLSLGIVSWQNEGNPIAGNGAMRVITNPAAGATRQFYRILSITP